MPAALRALGEDVSGYGKVLAPEILREFPDDICRRCIIHVKRAGHSKGDVKLMEFQGQKMGGALIAQKKSGETSHTYTFVPTTANLYVHSTGGKATRKIRSTEPFWVFCEFLGYWAQDCIRVTDVKERIEKLKTANRCFLCLNRGQTLMFVLRVRMYSAQDARRNNTGLFEWTRKLPLVRQAKPPLR
jgi:hypothetical protein